MKDVKARDYRTHEDITEALIIDSASTVIEFHASQGCQR